MTTSRPSVTGIPPCSGLTCSPPRSLRPPPLAGRRCSLAVGSRCSLCSPPRSLRPPPLAGRRCSLAVIPRLRDLAGQRVGGRDGVRGAVGQCHGGRLGGAGV